MVYVCKFSFGKTAGSAQPLFKATFPEFYRPGFSYFNATI
jgi:hypothetical protein